MKFLGTILLALLLTYNLKGQKSDSTFLKNLLKSNEESKVQIQQLSQQVAALKTQLNKQQRIGLDMFINTSLFLDAASTSANNLQSLVSKETYRNQIASLNNPTSNDLGFNLELEIQASLKALLQKAKKTNTSKFSQVISSFLNTGKSGINLFPAGNVFTSIVGMAGNLTVQEKGIDQQDLDNFIKNIEKYFNQYERLYQSNLAFNNDMDKLKTKLKLLQDEINILTQDLILSLDKSIKRQQLKNLPTEELMLRYFNQKKLLEQLNKTATTAQYPSDAIKTCKEIATNIQRIYDEYASIYNNNFKEIKNIVADTKNVSTSVNQPRLNQTLRHLENLYNESKAIDIGNLRLRTLFDRLELITQ